MTVKTIYMVDKDNLLVDCLSATLEGLEAYETVGRSENGFDAYNEIRTLQPDLVLTELDIEILNGINLIRKIKASGLDTKVILLSSSISPSHIHKALSTGVDGIILKRDPFSLLLEAISVIHIRKFLSPGISDPLVNNFLSINGETGSAQRTSPLTDREEQVAKMIGDGVSSKEIARLLSISEKTVSKHRSNIFRKLNLKNTAQLVRYVYDNNLI